MNVEPIFDADGYPTDETLERVEKWDYTDAANLFLFLRKAWMFPMYFHEDKFTDRADHVKDAYYISTAGWSGNEDLIRALEKNHMIKALYWQRSEKGGHYIYLKP